MAGPYLYLVIVLMVLGMLGFKLYTKSQIPIETRHRPVAPITEEDIEAAVRAKRIPHAIQLYGLLHQCDLAESTQAVEGMVARFRAEDAQSTDPTDRQEPPDHRAT